MKAAVVYESLYGNTHAVANAIAEGLKDAVEPVVMSVAEAERMDPTSTDLLVVGGPTHVHGMSRKPMWEAAVNDALQHAEKGLVPDASSELDKAQGKAAAFDTRLQGNELLTGHASKGIAKRLRQHGLELVAEPASFLVDDTKQLLPGELDRAREWGKMLGSAVSSRT